MMAGTWALTELRYCKKISTYAPVYQATGSASQICLCFSWPQNLSPGAQGAEPAQTWATWKACSAWTYVWSSWQDAGSLPLFLHLHCHWSLGTGLWSEVESVRGKAGWVPRGEQSLRWFPLSQLHQRAGTVDAEPCAGIVGEDPCSHLQDMGKILVTYFHYWMNLVYA